MTPGLAIGLITAIVALIAVLVTVLVWVRRDSKQTGKVEEKVNEFSAKLLKLDTERDTVNKSNDSKIAEALRLSNQITAQRDEEILAAVKGFRATVDELKAEFAAIKNMWAGERRLVEKLRDLELEITKMIERFRSLEQDLTQLKRDHDRNHPRESGPIPLHRQDGAPRHLAGQDDGGKDE